MRLNQRFDLPPRVRERGRKISLWIRLSAYLLMVATMFLSVARFDPEHLPWAPWISPRFLLKMAYAAFVLMLLGLLATVVFDEGKPESPKGAE